MRKSVPMVSQILGSLLLLLSAFTLHAQTRISGTVTSSSSGLPLPGVTVTAKGTRVAVQTNSDGVFNINAPSNASTLVFTSVGFAPQEMTISGRSTIDLALTENNSRLDDVVVVAYGSRRRGDLTGAVTSISAKDFQKGFIPSTEQLLQGKVAGLQITNGGGYAGGGSRIRIRGGSSLNASNDPLIVIDGVPIQSNSIPGSGNYLNTINPNDIESISVLKDASATALYGSRASNGVIIITTKKGTKGKIKYNFNSQFSMAEIRKTVDVLTADELRAVVIADAAATGNNTWKNFLGTANTDWQNEIYQKAFGFDNNLSASGSLGPVPFRASVGYLNQQGTLKTELFNRFSSALNLSPKFLDDHVALNVNVKYSQTNNHFADAGAIGSSTYMDPTQPLMAPNKYGGYFEWLQADTKPIDLAPRNPLAMLMQRKNQGKVNRLIGNAQLDYKLHFFPDLHVLFNVAMDHAEGSGNDNIDSLMAYQYKSGGRKSHYIQGKENNLIDVQLFYTKAINSIRSKVDFLAGHSYQDFYTKVRNFAAFSYRAIADPAQPLLKDTIADSRPTFATDKPQSRLESYYARLNFSIHDKYLFTGSIRRDASSKFAEANRVGYFPSFAVAWKMNEDFIKNTNIVSDLKLRLGWGVTGQQDGIGNYSYQPLYRQSNITAQYQFGNTYYSYLRPEGYDANIKWETTTTTNVGLDFGFANNRVTGTVDYYFKNTEDLLSQIPVAPGSNFANEIVTNVGNVENRGVELTINVVPVKQGDVVWDIGFNVAYNKTEITNLLKQSDPNFKGINVGGIGIATGNYIGKFTVGEAPYSYFVYKQIYDKNDMPIEGLYEDINRDGRVDDQDRYLYKKPAADVLIGGSTQLVYKKLTFGASAHGMIGNYLFNQYAAGNAILSAIKNPLGYVGNSNARYLETRFATNSNNEFLSDYYIENASFLRIDNINIGYNVGKILKNKATLRISGSIQNVHTFTNYRGLDPENSSDAGIDGNIYPRPRVYSIGFNFDF